MMKPPRHSSTPSGAKKENKPLRFVVKKKPVEPNAPAKPHLPRKLLLIILGFLIIVFSGLAFTLWRFFQPVPGRLNLLVLGVSGGDHAGSDLTDALTFVSVDRTSGQVHTISLPRDIWLPEWRTKLNAIYHYHGLEGAKAEVAKILGQPVDYGVVLDFQVFERVIDALGGVEVEVERTFDDFRFPVPGRENDLCDGDPEFACRYEHLYFAAGSQLMDGPTALKFVRSRNAAGEEGSDFARSARQQRLLAAVKNRLLSPSFWYDYRRPLGLWRVVRQNITTDFLRSAFIDLLKTAVRFRSDKLSSQVLNGDRLINPPPTARYDHQWVLVPRTGDWTEVQKYVAEFLMSD